MARFRALVLKYLLIYISWTLLTDFPPKNAGYSVFTLSVIQDSTTTSIWCALDFDIQLYSELTRWRRFDYGIRSSSSSSLLLLGGDIELNPGPAQQLKVALFNARSLVNKSAFLEADVYSRNFDIVAVTETHLDDSIRLSELFPQKYRVFRRDRNRKGGGVLVAVNENIICNERDILEGNNAELLMIDIHCSRDKSFVFGVFYRPPSSDSKCLEILQRNLESLSHLSNIILVGDFNFKDIDWKNNLFLNYSINYELFSDILSDNFLNQMVLQPTRGDNILDLILTNHSDMVS